MTWIWLLVCWGCLLGGFVLGAWWGRETGKTDRAELILQILALEEEVAQLKRKVEWERRRADGILS